MYLNHCTANGLSDDFGDLVGGFFGTKPNPKDFSKEVLPKLRIYLNANPKGRFGVVIMDFPGDDIIRQIIMTNSSELLK